VDKIAAAYMLATAATFPQGDVTPYYPPTADNWCTAGYQVMVPDGRLGLVTSVSGDICRVLAEGEAYVSLIPHYIVEPVYPQAYLVHPMGH
jgi:hypothetical protein